jgi:predicted lipid-binding transport protein (Tim44 family)
MLTADVAERGTDQPTIVDPEARLRLDRLRARDAQFDYAALEARVRLVFEDFQIAWAARDLARMRPWFTDALFDTQRYWIAAYRAQGLRNVTEGARITRLELARVDADRYYDAITLRLFARGLDFTLDEAEQLVCGSRTTERAYTEYWTFVRSADRHGVARAARECPSCGAALDVEMAGDCKYCRAKVTTGAFDWVLSRIEQDEVYRG